MLLGGQWHGSAGAFVLERLRSLGFNDFWVRKKLADGERFRLALFPRASAFAATWDGIMSLVREHYPQRLADKVTQHETSLRSERFEAIQAQAGFLRGASYFEINEAAALVDLGLDSLDLVGLRNAFTKAFGKTAPLAVFTNANQTLVELQAKLLPLLG